MPMVPETMNDILVITQRLHGHLSKHLEKSADDTESERSKLLLEYLANHEEKLARTLERFQKETDLGPLDTWFYAYTDRHKIIDFDPYKAPFTNVDPKAIAAQIADLHNQLIDLYQHLHDRAESNSAKEVLSQLLAIEEDKGKLLSFEAGRADEF